LVIPISLQKLVKPYNPNFLRFWRRGPLKDPSFGSPPFPKKEGINPMVFLLGNF